MLWTVDFDELASVERDGELVHVWGQGGEFVASYGTVGEALEAVADYAEEELDGTMPPDPCRPELPGATFHTELHVACWEDEPDEDGDSVMVDDFTVDTLELRDVPGGARAYLRRLAAEQGF